jgi:putative tricarboxylic transport membrane protein
MLESNLRRALVMSQGDLSIFYKRPIALVLIILAVITLVTPIVTNRLKKRREQKEKMV